MSDIDISISAKDQASQILDGVEQATRVLTDNVVDLGKTAVRVGSKMEVNFDGVAESLDQVSSKAAGIGGSLLKGLRAMADVTIIAQGIGSLVRSVSDFVGSMSSAVDAYNQQIEVARGANQAQLEFAASFQKLTNVGDESTLALMKTAEAMGVAKDQTDEVVQSAIGLSEAFGISQEEALKKTIQAVNGNANAFAEMLPEMRAIDEAAKRNQGAFRGLTEDQKRLAVEQEKLAVINAAAAGGLARLSDDAQSTRGVMERSAGAFGDLSEKIGELFDPLYRLIHSGLAVFAETLQSTIQPAIDMVNAGFGVTGQAVQSTADAVGGASDAIASKFAGMAPLIDFVTSTFQKLAVVVGVAIESVVSVLGSMVTAVIGSSTQSAGGLQMLSDAIDFAAKFIIGAITFIEVAVTNLPTIWEMAVTAIALRIEQIRADVEHVFTTVIPAYIKWFGENALNLLQDYVNLYVTIFANFGKKIANFFSTLISFIGSGFSGGFSGLTKQLGEAMAGSLIEGFEAKTQPLPEIAARSMTGAEELLANDLARMGGDLAGQFTDKFNERVADLDVNVTGAVEIEPPDLAQISNISEQIKPKLQVDVQRIQADEQRLITRGVQEDPTRQVADNTRKTAEGVAKLPGEIAKQLAPLVSQSPPQTFEFVEVT